MAPVFPDGWRKGLCRRFNSETELFHLESQLTSGGKGDGPFPAVFGVLTRRLASGGYGCSPVQCLTSPIRLFEAARDA
jgi:hypothetical protein